MSADDGREEHLAWCKRRALEYLDRAEIANAGASMMSDLNKHPETRVVYNGPLSQLGIFYVLNDDYAGMRRWIEGFR